VRLAVGHADQHESAATNISGRRVHHGQREPGGHRRIDCVAACLHDVDADMGRQFVHADYDSVLRMNRMYGSLSRRRRAYREKRHQQQNQ